MISMAVTVIVMGAIFALLTRAMRTTDAEFERSDLQAQARHALDQISRDLLLAGTALPPEFPAFTPPSVNPELDASGGGPEAIEIVGCYDTSAGGVQPAPIVSFDGEKVRTEILPAHIEQGDLVLVYDDQPTNGTWLFGLVSSIDTVSSYPGGPIRELTIKTDPGEREGDITLPSFIDHYNRPSPSSGFITPVTVVSYKTGPDDPGLGGGQVLWRQVNWGEPTQLAFVEDLQFRYFIGGTVEPSDDEIVPLGAPDGEVTDLRFPPAPQPDPLMPLVPDQLVGGVGVSVTSRSDRANLEGSTVRSGQSPSEAGFLRVTFSSRIAARNIMSRLSARENLKFK
jgi:hypothetical protein